MKKIINVFLFICLFFSLISCSKKQNDYSDLSSKAKEIADIMISQYDTTSVQYAIIDKGEIILSDTSGVYDRIENRAITKDDMFGIGSTSKMFITASIMMLAEQGKIDIDKPLTTYISEFRMADARYKDITVRMLLNHSSGIYGSSFSNSVLFDEICSDSYNDLLNRLATQNLRTAPGEMSEYCNDGFTLLELLLERVSGISYTKFITDYFTKPLGLTHTKTPQDDFDRKQIVKAYSPLYDGALPVDTLNLLGSGGLYSTAEDLCKFSEVLMGNKPEILSFKSTLLMRNEEYKKGMWPDDNNNSMLAFGLGWDNVCAYPFKNYNINVVVKGGDTQIFHSSLVTIPDYDIAMAVVSSGGNSAFDCTFASNILLQLLQKKGVIKEISPDITFKKPVKIEMPEVLCKYSGLYSNANNQLTVEIKDGKLIITALGNLFEYVYIGNNVFQSDDGSENIKFMEFDNGDVFIQSQTFPTIPQIGQFASCAFKAQKIESVTISHDILDVWNKRVGMKYYVVSEKPSSQCYFIDPTLSCVQLRDDFTNGYAFAGTRIINENYAKNTLVFRDVKDLIFSEIDNIEYLRTSDLIYVSEASIPKMNFDTVSCTIEENGYTKYFTVDDSIVGKTMIVNIPKGASFVVYDENDICINFTTVNHNNEIILPSNCIVGFIGKVNDTFTIEIK